MRLTLYLSLPHTTPKLGSSYRYSSNKLFKGIACMLKKLHLLFILTSIWNSYCAFESSLLHILHISTVVRGESKSFCDVGRFMNLSRWSYTKCIYSSWQNTSLSFRACLDKSILVLIQKYFVSEWCRFFIPSIF